MKNFLEREPERAFRTLFLISLALAATGFVADLTLADTLPPQLRVYLAETDAAELKNLELLLLPMPFLPPLSPRFDRASNANRFVIEKEVV